MYRQRSFGIEIVDAAHIPLPPRIPPIQFLGDGDRTEEQVFSELAVAALRAYRLLAFDLIIQGCEPPRLLTAAP